MSTASLNSAQPTASAVLQLHVQRVHLLCLRQSSTDLTSPATLKCMTKWGPLGEGGQGSVSWAQLHRCELPAALNICSGYRGAVKVVKTAQFAWLDGKGVPGVVRKAAAEFESQLRAGQDAMYSLKPCSMGAIMFAVDFTDGILPQAAIDLADGTEADAVAAAYAVAHNHAVDPAGASQLGLDKPGKSLLTSLTDKALSSDINHARSVNVYYLLTLLSLGAEAYV